MLWIVDRVLSRCDKIEFLTINLIMRMLYRVEGIMGTSFMSHTNRQKWSLFFKLDYGFSKNFLKIISVAEA